MKPEWKAFLRDAGAEFRDEEVASFGNPERELQVAVTGDVFCELSHYGLIGAHGSDTQAFLHSQLTHDIETLTAEQSRLAGYCNPKGRLYAVMRAFWYGDTLYLRMPRGVLEQVLKRLRLFVLRSDVTLEDASASLVRLGCAGPSMERELGKWVHPLPARPGDAVHADELTVIRVPAGPYPRFEIYGSLEAVQSLWSALNVRAAPVGSDAWGLQEIKAGLPTILPATMEAFVPQMVNLELVDGVSFKKGCYPGQEVVARTQYLGTPKRRMYRGWTDTHIRPQPGADIVPAGGGERAGTIVDARPSPDGGHELLAVLQIAAAGQTGLRIGTADGPGLELHDLPYDLGISTGTAD